jgi:hypothetical protein
MHCSTARGAHLVPGESFPDGARLLDPEVEGQVLLALERGPQLLLLGLADHSVHLGNRQPHQLAAHTQTSMGTISLLWKQSAEGVRECWQRSNRSVPAQQISSAQEKNGNTEGKGRGRSSASCEKGSGISREYWSEYCSKKSKATMSSSSYDSRAFKGRIAYPACGAPFARPK